MANTKSAEKNNRQRIKKRARNLLHLTKTRTLVKRATAAISQPEIAKEEVGMVVKAATTQLAKAAQKGVLNKKTASRKISRLAKAFNQV